MALFGRRQHDRAGAADDVQHEPGIYIRGDFGVRLEDCMHITEEGAKPFTGTSVSLKHPFEIG